MSSSWKLPREPEPEPEAPRALLPDDVILLPGVAAAPETTYDPLSPRPRPRWPRGLTDVSLRRRSAAMSLHASKKAAKKSADMRVSCEAIPEEMCGTSPLQPAPAPPPAVHKVGPPRASRPPQAVERALPQTASDSAVGPGEPQRTLGDDLPPLARSKRSNTISVMSPTRRARPAERRREAPRAAGAGGGGVTPSFVFLQLYHNMSTYPLSPPVPGEAPGALDPLAERPLRVTGAQHERTVKNLDLVPPIETHKVGVLYVGPGQHDNEVLILRNEFGSVR